MTHVHPRLRIVLASRAAVWLSAKAAARAQTLSSAGAGSGAFGPMAVGFGEAASSVVSRLGRGVGAPLSPSPSTDIERLAIEAPAGLQSPVGRYCAPTAGWLVSACFPRGSGEHFEVRITTLVGRVNRPQHGTLLLCLLVEMGSCSSDLAQEHLE